MFWDYFSKGYKLNWFECESYEGDVLRDLLLPELMEIYDNYVCLNLAFG